MQILKLTSIFYSENSHLKEVLDKKHDVWDSTKIRGYGIILLEFNSLRFGVPLRSNINHKNCFITVGCKGLDYTKAVLLHKDEYILQEPFEIDKEEYKKIREKSHKISKDFNQFILRYIKGITNKDQNILKYYIFSTLQNYHQELGLE